MDLVLTLQEGTLSELQRALLASEPYHSMKNLNAVSLTDFCQIALPLLFPHTQHTLKHTRRITHLFDAVDVDSRGFVSFSDLSNHCLRACRNEMQTLMPPTSTVYETVPATVHVLPIRSLVYLKHKQILFAMDATQPFVYLFRSVRLAVTARRDELEKFNPVRALEKKLLLTDTHNQDRHKRREKTKKLMSESGGGGGGGSGGGASEAAVGAGQHSHVLVLFVEEIKQHKQYVVSTSDGNLTFFLDKTDVVLGHATADLPQVGMCYSFGADVLISWPGQVGDHTFRVWDVSSRSLCFSVKRHANMVCAFCEAYYEVLNNVRCFFFASASIDRKVVLWASAPIAAPQSEAQRSAAQVDTKVLRIKQLVGHHHSIRSLIFAPARGVIFGAGFDFTIVAWDVGTQVVVMRLLGHVSPVISIQLLSSPLERLASVDDTGVVKIWDIDISKGSQVSPAQSLQVRLPNRASIHGFVAAFQDGTTIAVLADRIYFFTLEASTADDVRPVGGGLGICERAGRVFMATRSMFTQGRLNNGHVLRRLPFMDEGRGTGAKLVNVVVSEKASSGDAISSSTATSSNNNFLASGDCISAMTTDPLGKKLFVGTARGRILCLDSSTFGLLMHLTSSKEVYKAEQGGVGSLYFFARDELLVAAYANGAVKIFVGCHRTCETLGDNLPPWAIEYFRFPSPRGGLVPAQVHLLRDCDYSLSKCTVICSMAVCEEHNLIATCCQTGALWVYDYLSLQLVAAFQTPPSSIPDRAAEGVDVCFAPTVPIMFSCDSIGRISAWTLPPLTVSWIGTWDAHLTSLSGRGGRMPSVKDSGDVGKALRCLRCAFWHASSERSSVEKLQPQENPWSEDEISTAGRKWSLVVGDEEGMCLLLDVTPLIKFSGCLMKHFEPRSLAVGAAHQQFSTRRNYKEGMLQRDVVMVAAMIAKPIGTFAKPVEMDIGAIFIHGWQTSRKKNKEDEGVVQIVVVQQQEKAFPLAVVDKRNNSILAQCGRPPAEPTLIMIASARGEVHLFTWQGRFQGTLSDGITFIAEGDGGEGDEGKHVDGWSIPTTFRSEEDIAAAFARDVALAASSGVVVEEETSLGGSSMGRKYVEKLARWTMKELARRHEELLRRAEAEAKEELRSSKLDEPSTVVAFGPSFSRASLAFSDSDGLLQAAPKALIDFDEPIFDTKATTTSLSRTISFTDTLQKALSSSEEARLPYTEFPNFLVEVDRKRATQKDSSSDINTGKPSFREMQLAVLLEQQKEAEEQNTLMMKAAKERENASLLRHKEASALKQSRRRPQSAAAGGRKDGLIVNEGQGEGGDGSIRFVAVPGARPSSASLSTRSEPSSDGRDGDNVWRHGKRNAFLNYQRGRLEETTTTTNAANNGTVWAEQGRRKGLAITSPASHSPAQAPVVKRRAGVISAPALPTAGRRQAITLPTKLVITKAKFRHEEELDRLLKNLDAPALVDGDSDNNEEDEEDEDDAVASSGAAGLPVFFLAALKNQQVAQVNKSFSVPALSPSPIAARLAKTSERFEWLSHKEEKTKSRREINNGAHSKSSAPSPQAGELATAGVTEKVVDEEKVQKYDIVQGSNSRSRFGPYTSRDMLSIASLWIKLEAAAFDLDMVRVDGGCESYDALSVAMLKERNYSVKSILKLDALSTFPGMKILIDSARKENAFDPRVTRKAMLALMFEHAIESEQARIEAFIAITMILRAVLNEMQAPAAGNLKTKRRGSSHHHEQQNIHADGNPSLAFVSSWWLQHRPHAVRIFGGFTLSLTRFVDVRNYLDEAFDVPTGTVVVQDVCDILLSFFTPSDVAESKCLSSLESVMKQTLKFDLASEINGTMLHSIFEKVLKIRLADSSHMMARQESMGNIKHRK